VLPHLVVKKNRIFNLGQSPRRAGNVLVAAAQSAFHASPFEHHGRYENLYSTIVMPQENSGFDHRWVGPIFFLIKWDQKWCVCVPGVACSPPVDEICVHLGLLNEGNARGTQEGPIGGENSRTGVVLRFGSFLIF
jgi:hypothetical protein